MDLLEIRKKAKEKEGGDKGLPLTNAPAASPAEDRQEIPSEVAVKKQKREKRKRQSVKKAAATSPKTEEPDSGLSVELAEEPGTFCEPPDVSADKVSPPAGNAGDKNTAKAPVVAEDTSRAPESSDEIIEYLAFLLANEEYAVKVDDIKEIIRGQNITIVPRTPGFVLGIISLRGVILPVFDIKKRLGLEGGVASRKTSRIIVVADKYGLQGIMVDKVTGVVKLKGSTIEPPPAIIGGVEAEYLQGLGRIGDRLLILFDTDKVLTVG